MKCYVKPSEGEQNSIFLSYCHDDAAQVYPIIERLAIEGFHVWFDTGIHPGEEWPETIARHMIAAKVCVAMISPAAAESLHCRNELTFALSNSMPILAVMLEDFKMPLGMQMQLGNTRYIRKYEETEDNFYSELLNSPVLVPCRSIGSSADPEALKLWRLHSEEYGKDPGGEKNRAVMFVTVPSHAPTYSSEMKIPGEQQNESASELQGEEGSPEKPEQSPSAEKPQAERKAGAAGADRPEEEEDDEKTILSVGKDDDDEDEHTIVGIRYNPALLLRVRTGEIFPIKSERTVLGRNRSRADLAFPDNPEISGKHAEIWQVGKGFTLRNFNPTNVTMVNGQPLEENASAELRPCSEIMLADEQFFLLFGEAYEFVFDEQKICLLKSRDTGETRVLAEDSLLLDRRHKWRNDVLGDQRIHRSGHAEIYRENGRICVRDLGSRHGTFVNGRQLEPNVGTELHDNDIIAVVDTEFIYYEIKTGT